MSSVRSLLIGALLGAFGVCWWLDVLPKPVDDFLNNQVETLAEKAGLEIDLGPDEDEGAEALEPASDAAEPGGDSSAETMSGEDTVRRSGLFDGSRLTEVYTCPGMSTSNQPPTDDDGKLSNFSALIDIKGVFLSKAPVSHGCLSSGYGDRDGKMHKGVDYHSMAVSEIHAAADGVVVEAEYRDDYGNMIVLDHGNGVYTRYAHLASFADGITVGAAVSPQSVLGIMGQSAGYKVVVHLHYEVLLGDFNTAAKSFGLTSTDPMGLQE